jgi:hypothetical protein
MEGALLLLARGREVIMVTVLWGGASREGATLLARGREAITTTVYGEE